MNKLLIEGSVLCDSCGGDIITNSGKVMMGYKYMWKRTIRVLICWHCSKKFNMEKCYDIRKEGESVVYYNAKKIKKGCI